MNGQGANQLGPGGGEPQRDRAAHGGPCDVGRSEPEQLDQRGEVVDVVANASLARRAGAAAVAAAVVGDDLERAGKQGQDAAPNPAVNPRPVYEDERLPGPAAPVVKLDSIELADRHRPLPPRPRLLQRFPRAASEILLRGMSQENVEIVRRAYSLLGDLPGARRGDYDDVFL